MLNDRPATLALFAFATIDAQREFKIAGLAIGVLIISETCTTSLDRLAKDLLNLVGDLRPLRALHLLTLSRRPHTGAKKRFIRVNVPDPDDDMSVHKIVLYRHGFASRFREEVLSQLLGRNIERLGAELSQEFMIDQFGLRAGEDASETPRIHEMKVLFAPHLFRLDPKTRVRVLPGRLLFIA